MASILVRTGRPVAWLVFIFCAAVALRSFWDHEWFSLLLFAVPAAAGLALGLAANLRIQDENRRRRLQRIQAWNGAEMIVPLDRRRWVASLGLCTSLAVVGFTLALATTPGLRTVGIVLGASCAYLILIEVVRGRDALRAGWVLKLDSSGIHHFRGASIPWRDVLAVELTSRPVPFARGRPRQLHFLAVSLRPQAPGVRVPGFMERLVGLRIAPMLRDGKLEFALNVGAVDPDLLLQAARVIGARAGVPVGSGWSGFSFGRSQMVGGAA